MAQKGALLRNIGCQGNYSEQDVVCLYFFNLSFIYVETIQNSKRTSKPKQPTKRTTDRPTNHSTITTENRQTHHERHLSFALFVTNAAHIALLHYRVACLRPFFLNFKLRSLMNADVSFHVLQMVRHNLNNKS
jgi:hypothetical protein